MIDVYTISYPIFYNEKALKQIMSDDEKIKSTLSTFFGVLLNLESRDTYDSNKCINIIKIILENEFSILDWTAINMGTIFT